jgi:hypothetical protein
LAAWVAATIFNVDHDARQHTQRFERFHIKRAGSFIACAAVDIIKGQPRHSAPGQFTRI